MRRAALAGLLAALAWAAPAAAQLRLPGRSGAPLSGNTPVTFQADHVTYDRDRGLVTAEGHVEAWQNDHLLRADRITFDRNTNVAAAQGHVVLVEPDGQVLFAQYAELTQGMKEGVLTRMRAILAENGKLAANGGRRVAGKLNVLSRGVYSTCNVCAKDPSKPPLWQMRAFQITQDVEHKRIEYRDAWLDFAGLPVFYFPYFSNSDPSVHRQSGLLVPSIGVTDKHLGTFVTIPYYYVIDGQSDVTVIPLIATKTGPQLEADYRLDLNNGILRANGAIAQDEDVMQGFLQAHGIFAWNDTWRYGFTANLATSTNYLRDFRIPGYGANELPSTAFIEGFGDGAYARFDVRTFQALNSSVNQSELPYVLPRYEYSLVGQPDALGGTFSFETQNYNILREVGTNDQRFAGTLRYDRPFAGYLGDRWRLTAQVAGAAYNATLLNQQPNYNLVSHATAAQADPQVAVKLNWPFLRDGGELGTQIVEPIVQVIEGANQGNPRKIHVPVEDAFDYEFTDLTLFSLNRWGGYDRFDEGLRVNAGLHGNWTFRSGAAIDALVGISWQQHIDHDLAPFFSQWNGLDRHLSDAVGRISLDPNPWLNFTARARVDRENGDLHFGDAIASAGTRLLRVNAGYLYSSTDPYYLYLPFASQGFYTPGAFAPNSPGYSLFFTPRNEITAGADTHFGHYSLGVSARRDLRTGQLVYVGANGKYEDECFIFDINLSRRYTSINFDNGDTTILFTLTFKTVGTFGFNAS